MMWLMSPAQNSTAHAASFAPLLVKEGLGVVELTPRSDTELGAAVLEIPTSHSITGKSAPTTATTIPERAA